MIYPMWDLMDINLYSIYTIKMERVIKVMIEKMWL